MPHLEDVLTSKENPEVLRALQLPPVFSAPTFAQPQPWSSNISIFPSFFWWNGQQLHDLHWVGAIENDRRPMNKTQTCLFCAVLSK